MRHTSKPLDADAETTGYTFHFQISNAGSRQACSVKVQAPTMQDATAFFRQNWSTIELMARDDSLKHRATTTRSNSSSPDAACLDAAPLDRMTKRYSLAAISASFATVFMLRIVPVLAAGILSLVLAMPSA